MQIVTSHHHVILPKSACALGMFDGVHIGHQMVLAHAIRQARLIEAPSVVFSFQDHPQRLLAKTPTLLLSSLEERLAHFEALGFDMALILEFNPWFQQLSARAFVEEILVKPLGVQEISVGYDYRFGKDRLGHGELLNSLGQEFGFGVSVIDPVRTEVSASTASQIVSSTLIRKLLSFGDVQQANSLLGRPYQLKSIVEKGFQRGRQLGFPTANLSIDLSRLIPASGVYSGWATHQHQTYQALCNIGHSPTFEGGTPQTRVEVFLLDYDGPDFYGNPLAFDFINRLRDEMPFSTVNDLVQQIQLDCEQARHSLV